MSSALASVLKEMQIEADDGRRRVGFDVELVGLHGKHGEQVAVRMIALGRARAAMAGPPKSVRVCKAPADSLPLALPAPSASSLTFAGVFPTRRCQKPEPVGVGIITGDGEAFRALGRARPAKMRRLLPPAQPNPKSADRI